MTDTTSAPHIVFLDTNVIRHVAKLRLGRPQQELDAVDLQAADELFRLAECSTLTLRVPDAVRRQAYGTVDQELEAMSGHLLAQCQVDRKMTFPIELPIVFWSDADVETMQRIRREASTFMQPNDCDLCSTAVAVGAQLVVTFDRAIARPEGQAYRYFEREFALLIVSPSEAVARVRGDLL